ncbi:alpha/beta-hydrolase [Echria macrotheca]|uniref:Alpha/beta-hydrolase n=1 Tax=Echria macrotheca TaxID=438768 RepID=A0AAJ0B3Z8_9PEZI|nr:alpha/beta-hydrolase [Echria macrotheca]
MENSRAPLQKKTTTFAVHQIPLECDIYDAHDYSTDSPVFLYFHPGGLVAGARIVVPPWLAQTCFRHKWPLISASYRLLPQARGEDLLQDATAAYEFARTLGGAERKVIVGGASAGNFLATLIAHHLTPKPLAVLSITGIPTFRHRFFNSSVLIPSEPVTEDDVAPFVSGPVTIGRDASHPLSVFDVHKLDASGAKNPLFVPGDRLPPEWAHDPERGLLYDFYLHENLFLDFVGSVDPGFDWAENKSDPEKLKNWPTTIFIQGDADDDVEADVCSSVASALGDKAMYFEAKGMPHLYERHMFLEDIENGTGPGEVAVKQAITALDGVIGGV